jgi:hypothetical protein
VGEDEQGVRMREREERKSDRKRRGRRKRGENRERGETEQRRRRWRIMEIMTSTVN